MKKRLLSLVMALAMIASAMCITSTTTASAIDDADFVAPEILIPDYLALPDDDLLTDDHSFILAEGTRYEQTVTSLFIDASKANRPGTFNTQKYIIVHNTGSYPASSTALANANYCRNTDASVSWHYTCGNDGIHQQLPVNEKGWHAGGDYWASGATYDDKVAAGWIPDASNSSSVGIETCVDGFPADNTSAGEHWNSAEMYEWYETHFDKTATYLAILVSYLCVKMNFNPYTQVATHYNSAAKNCPMQMRYIFGTNAKFAQDGTYYKVFLDRMYDYYEAFGGSYVSTDTFQNSYYNPSYKYYETGLYKANSAVTVYRAGNTATQTVGTVASGEVVSVEITGWNWGKITLSNGTKGWVNLDNFTFVTDAYDYGTYKTATGDIVNVTAIDGTTATYAGGTADISTLTRVYKVEVKGDTAFGSEAKYLASGEKFTVTATTPTAPMVFDIWEVVSGIATIEEKTATTTEITVLNSDIIVSGSERDKYDLVVESGTGSGRYEAGSTVEINARGKVGQTFKAWVVESGEAIIADVNSAITTVTTGAADTVISATYEEATTFDLTGLTNYALNKSYTFTWRDQTGSSISWYDTTVLKRMRDEGCTIMTDGVVEDDNSYTYDNKFCAITGTAGTAIYVFDLGEIQEITRIVLRDLVIQSSWGDISDIAISVSDDGENFTNTQVIDNIYHSFKTNADGSTEKISDTLYTHCIDVADLSAVSGRYVKFVFKSTKYVTAYTEIEVYGPSVDDGGDEPPVDDTTSEDSSIEDPSVDDSSESGSITVGNNLLLNKDYTVVTDATANKADGGDYATNGALRGDGTNAWNESSAVDGVSIEWFGTSKTITYTFTFDAATNVDKIVFRNVRIASNRAFGTLVINGSTIIMSADSVKTPVADAPLYAPSEGAEPVDQYFDVSVDVDLNGITELTITLITDMYVCQYDEIEAYGELAGEDGPSEEPSEVTSSEEPSEVEPSEEPSEVEPSEEPSDVEPSEETSEETSDDASEETSEDESSEEEADVVYGDVNNDGVVNSLDAAQTLKHDAKLITLDDAALVAADVNGDGTVNSLDAAQVLKFDAKLIDSFPVEDVADEESSEELSFIESSDAIINENE